MFKSFTPGDWHAILAIIAFTLTVSVFAVGVWRALRIKPNERDYLASLPLDDETPAQPQIPTPMDEQKKSEPEQHRRGDFAKEKGEVILREHEFDGIQEFDQKLPNWWLFTLYIAIAWAGVHWFLHYHTGLLQTDAERMAEWSAQVEAAKTAELDKLLETLDDTTLVNVWSADPEIVAAGETTYSTVCVACHAPDLTATMAGAPLPGLSLIDGEWKFGGKPMEIFNLIKNGSPPESEGHNGAKMMPWGLTLPPDKIAEVTAFILSKNRKEYPLP